MEPDNPALQRRAAEVAALREQQLPTLPSTLALELATNPFLRVTETTVRANSEIHAQHPLASPSAVFAALRSWKDNFR
ncbi:Hydroxyacylglutathione hydrolase [compost metagenome]